MNPLEFIYDALGYNIGPIEWFLLSIGGYFIFGFGGVAFDLTAWRFRDSPSGRFIAWEPALILGIIVEGFLILALFNTMDIWDKIASIFGLVICIGITIVLGISTRKDGFDLF